MHAAIQDPRSVSWDKEENAVTCHARRFPCTFSEPHDVEFFSCDISDRAWISGHDVTNIKISL